EEVFANPRYLFSFLLMFALIFYIFWIVTNHEMIIANLGLLYHRTEIVFMFLIAFFFSSFFILSIYNINYFCSFGISEGTVGGIVAFLGIIVVGCPACSITLASYIGLAGLLSGLPLFGLELKFISIPMLLYANYA